MGSPRDSASSSLWTTLGQASNIAQLAGVDALGLVSMVVQAALAARSHREACRLLAQHVELVGSLLQELELAELMRRDATRRPLEQLRGALRRCYALATACQDCGYLRRLLFARQMAHDLRAAQQEIDMFIRLIPLIALVDDNNNRRAAKAAEGAPSVITGCSNLGTRFSARVMESTGIPVHGANKPGIIKGKPFEGTVDVQEQRITNLEELVKLCTRAEERRLGFRKFDFFQILDATDNFSEERIIGRGGFGTVYKGHFPDGLTFAIKRHEERAEDFRSELKLTVLQHTNIIRLLGWCIHGKERILVYEFAHKGSLHNIMFERRNGAFLNWSKRFQIIKGVAEGLVYLHKHSMLWIVHRDLNPNNVLLDRDMNPKIADFGSAMTLNSDVAEKHTRSIVGTRGYMAPEYASRGLNSMKTDVFSFGVLVLVIISGRKNTIMKRQGDTVGYLVYEAWHKWQDGRLHELVDPSLLNGYELAEVMRCTQVALLCAQEDAANRPVMADVATMLSSESLLSYPKQPTELVNGSANGDTTSTYIGQSSNTIDITITSSAPVTTRIRVIVGPAQV